MKENKSLIREKIVSIIIAKKLLWESIKLKFKEVTGYESKKDKELKELERLKGNQKEKDVFCDDVELQIEPLDEEELIRREYEKYRLVDVEKNKVVEDSNPITVND